MPFQLRAKFWQNRITRIAVGTTVLAVALVVQYYLTKLPRHSIDIGERRELSPATVKQSLQQLVIDGPVVASPEGKLFSRDSEPNEVVDVRFDNARVDEQTVEDLSNPALKSSSPESIDYNGAESRERSRAEEPCRTSLDVEFKDAKPPQTLYFYQMETAGADHRYLEMKTGGAELVVQMTTTTPPEATVEAEGCRKLLRVGNREPLRIPPFTPVRVIAATNSAFRFKFRAFDRNAKPLWNGPDGLFAPFDLGPPLINPDGPPPFLQAREVSVRKLKDGDSNPSSILSARGVAGRPLLSVYDLKIGSDNLQIRVSGSGEMRTHGQLETVNLLQRLEELGPLAKTLLVALNAALIAWFVRLLSKKDARTNANDGHA
jgi:hypothetical protein